MSDHRRRLEAIRDRLTEELDESAGRDLAPLARELRAVLAELESLPVPDSKAPADEIAKRRNDRRRRASGE